MRLVIPQFGVRVPWLENGTQGWKPQILSHEHKVRLRDGKFFREAVFSTWKVLLALDQCQPP
jgi:hypothetical protein